MELSQSADIEWVNPATLSRHPKNQEIYGDDPIDDLLVSIPKHGILEPIFVTRQGAVTSGDRRRRAACALNLPAVPVVRVTYSGDQAEHEAIVEHNRYRKKNGQQLAREGRLLETIYAEQAREKQLAQGERGKEGGRGNKKTHQAKFPEGFQPQPQTRDLVARDIGLGSGRQYDKLRHVAERAEAGDEEAIRVLPQINVNMSIDAAYKQVRRQEDRKRFLDKINSVPRGQVRASERVLYQQNGVTLIKGDCRHMWEVENDSVDLVVTDPPFNIGVNYGAGINDNLSPDEYATWTREWLLESLRVLKPGGQLFAIMPIKWMPWWMPEIRDLWVKHRAHLVIWNKTMVSQLHRENTWIRAWEPVLWMPKGGTPAVFHRGYRFENDRDLFTGPNAIAECEALKITKMHPTPRPSWLYREWLLLASEQGMLVLDPMMGSGTTASVANALDRKFLGYDLNEEWVHLSAERLRLQDREVSHSSRR